MGHRSLGLILLGLAVASAAAAVTGPVRPVGSELQVNTDTIGREWRSAVAANANGFVVVWDSFPDHDGDASGVFAQRYASNGTRLGVEFQVTTYTTFYQYFADAAMDADGDFIVVWQSFGQDDFSNGVFGQRFTSDGAPVAVEFQVNTTTSRDEREGSIAMNAAGDFVVAWTSFLGDGSSDAVLAQRFNSTGAKVGAEFLVNSYTFSTQKSPRVAMTAGSFVVVWQSFSQDDGFDYGVFGRRFGSNGAPLGVEFQVNLKTLLTQWAPDVAMGGAGDFVVVWESFEYDGDFKEVVGRRFDSSGAAQGGAFLVNTRTVEDQRTASVAKDATGAFVVVWTSYTDDSSYEDVKARYFDSAGIAEGLEFLVNELQVNSFTQPRESRPAIAATGEGKFIVAWESDNRDDTDFDVRARRVEQLQLADLDIDGNGQVTALTDGLLILRFLFGFSGTTLTSGVVGAPCVRCSASEIEDYLDTLGSTLDVDGNGSESALTDGLLIVRFLFGFTGTTLTSGVVGAPCTRCDAPEIIDYLEPLV